MLGTRMDL